MSSTSDAFTFGNENIWDLINRIRSFIGYIEKEAGTIAIVAHAGVNDIFINLANNREKDDFVKILQYNTCINILDYTQEKWSTIEINDYEHITALIPKLSIYDDQEHVKERVKEHILDKLGSCCSSILMKGAIATGNMGTYDRLYCGDKGTTIDIMAKFNDGFKVPTTWKISKYKNKVTEYEIGHILVNGIKHKLHLTELSSIDVRPGHNIIRIK